MHCLCVLALLLAYLSVATKGVKIYGNVDDLPSNTFDFIIAGGTP